MTKISKEMMSYSRGLQEAWEPTLHIRWIVANEKDAKPVLHQLWRSTFGSSRWVEVSTTSATTITYDE